MSYVLVIIGAAFGSSLRFFLTTIFNNQTFAYGTLIANSLGSFLAGVFFVIISQKLNLANNYNLVLLVGFCGSLTTLSAVSLEVINLFLSANYLNALISLSLNIILALITFSLALFLTKILI